MPSLSTSCLSISPALSSAVWSNASNIEAKGGSLAEATKTTAAAEVTMNPVNALINVNVENTSVEETVTTNGEIATSNVETGTITGAPTALIALTGDTSADQARTTTVPTETEQSHN